MEDVSPKNDSSMDKVAGQSLGQLTDKVPSLEPRADPDAQTTVTDFLDFTEYLPSDIVRSLTLIGKLDQTYADASHRINDLTAVWGRLPSLPVEERPLPVQLRADISEHLDSALSSRVLAHAEAVRMSDNVNRHYNKAKLLLAKLQKMMDNYPKEGPKSPVLSRSPQLSRTKLTVKPGDGVPKPKRPQVPRIIVPGEVQAPYDVDYDTYTDESDVSSDDESDTPAPGRRTPGPVPRIKLVAAKPPKTPNRLARPVTYSSAALTEAAAANNAALLQPPPDDAIPGSSDAPWLQLTQYELAKLRKRMKKNATWTPSETMVARELKALGRGPDAYRAEKKEAELAGRTFAPQVPAPVIVDNESGEVQLPAGAISAETLAAEEVPTTNRGMKLNEAKKLKREALAKQAAEEAEESARKMAEAAKLFLGSNDNRKASGSEPSKELATKTPKLRTTSRSSKRKRDADDEETNEANEKETHISRPPIKRNKTETPVPPPQHPSVSQSKVPSPEPLFSEVLTTPGEPVVTLAQTPVPLPPQGSSSNTRAAVSPTPSASNSNMVTATPSGRVPHTETPVPLPVPESRNSVAPLLPAVRETTKRQTRGDAAKITQLAQQQQEQNAQPQTSEEPQDEVDQALRSSSQVQEPPNAPQSSSTLAPESAYRRSSSRAQTPRTTPNPDGLSVRRPSSRGKISSQEPPPSLAADRPRRASTARNTPAPESRPLKRTKRPAPGIVSTTNSGGNSAVGKRKAAPRKKARTRRDKGPAETEMEDVDDEGNPIDPNEARYCLCNRVSFGTMIQCDNVDVSGSSAHISLSPSSLSPSSSSRTTARSAAPKKSKKQLTVKQNCKQEWFHLECVGLSNVPARTTKWYCPECRKLLNIGEKGQVSARGVRM